MDRGQFISAIRQHIGAGWPVTTADQMKDGWCPDGSDRFVVRFNTNNKRIRVDIFLDFFEDMHQKYQQMCDENSISSHLKINDLKDAMSYNYWGYEFDSINNICIVSFCLK
jgi:hypothetical protein